MWIPRSIEPKLRNSPLPARSSCSPEPAKRARLRSFDGSYYGFVSLDLPSEAEQAEKDPALFLQRHRPPVILDEVQDRRCPCSGI